MRCFQQCANYFDLDSKQRSHEQSSFELKAKGLTLMQTTDEATNVCMNATYIVAQLNITSWPRQTQRVSSSLWENIMGLFRFRPFGQRRLSLQIWAAYCSSFNKILLACKFTFNLQNISVWLADTSGPLPFFVRPSCIHWPAANFDKSFLIRISISLIGPDCLDQLWDWLQISLELDRWWADYLHYDLYCIVLGSTKSSTSIEITDELIKLSTFNQVVCWSFYSTKLVL